MVRGEESPKNGENGAIVSFHPFFSAPKFFDSERFRVETRKKGGASRLQVWHGSFTLV